MYCGVDRGLMGVRTSFAPHTETYFIQAEIRTSDFGWCVWRSLVRAGLGFPFVLSLRLAAASLILKVRVGPRGRPGALAGAHRRGARPVVENNDRPVHACSLGGLAGQAEHKEGPRGFREAARPESITSPPR